MPIRLTEAVEKYQALEQQGIYFAPIRHHSPACAYSVRALIEEIQPTHVVIEAPITFMHLLDDLLHPDCLPPIAILAQTELTTVASGFYPLSVYSPEWQALKAGQQIGATLQLIDLPWGDYVRAVHYADHDGDNEDPPFDIENIQHERYLAHSQYIQALAHKLHCRNHDDVWEHLFELRSPSELANWRAFFKDTFAWTSMVRLDYEEAVLAHDGSLLREAHMLGEIEKIRGAQPEASIVVVTGAFHTSALVEGLFKQRKVISPLGSDHSKVKDGAWLIRYSFDRLDALNGYASGMPSPYFYQKRWEALTAPNGDNQSITHACLAFISALITELRRDQQEAISFVAFRSVCEQVKGLMDLRRHAFPSRYDVMDALQTGLIKGDIEEAKGLFWQQIKTYFSGFALGQIPEGTQQVPLVAEVYQTAKQHRFQLADTLTKKSTLDIYRKPRHRERSQFLQTLAFLGLSFAQKTAGPDFFSPQPSQLLFEEWHYAWTSKVEAELIRLAEEGNTLDQVVLQRLLKAEETLVTSTQSTESGKVVHLTIQIALMGQQTLLNALLMRLEGYVWNDGKWVSLIHCGQQLLSLWQGRDFFNLQDHQSLPALLHTTAQQALFHLDQIAQKDEVEAHLPALIAMGSWLKALSSTMNEPQHCALFHTQLDRITPILQACPLMLGAVDAIRYLDDHLPEKDLHARILEMFSISADAHHAVHYLQGLMRVVPEIITQLPILLETLDTLMHSLSEETFIAILPNLRFALSQLNPKESQRFAEKIAERYGIASDESLSFTSQLDETMLQAGLALNLQLRHQLQAKGLSHWIKGH